MKYIITYYTDYYGINTYEIADSAEEAINIFNSLNDDSNISGIKMHELGKEAVIKVELKLVNPPYDGRGPG